MNIKKQIRHRTNTLTDLKKKVYICKKPGTLNQITTASRIMILTYEMTVNERFNMIELMITHQVSGDHLFSMDTKISDPPLLLLCKQITLNTP